MEALIIKHHTKMLERWAKTIVGWYKIHGPQETQRRTDLFLKPEDVVIANPIIKQEFKKQGYSI